MEEIDRLIAELHATGDATPAATGDTARLERWLRLLSDASGVGRTE